MAQDATPLWPQMTAAQRAAAYSPSTMVEGGDLGPYLRAYADQSATAYAELDVQTLHYGPCASQTIDVTLPKADQPTALHVFVHGGYWQQLSKRDSFFPAPQMVAQGTAFAALDYTLAPYATLDEIVLEVVAALRHLKSKAKQLNIDPAGIVVSGSSAGAQLAAMATLNMEPAGRPSGVALLSGIYDLRPLVGTYINDALGLDEAAACAQSPAMRPLEGFPPAVVTWGAQDTDEFKRQSRQFAQLLRDAGVEVESFEVPARNHFDVVHDLAGDTPLGRAVSRLSDI